MGGRRMRSAALPVGSSGECANLRDSEAVGAGCRGRKRQPGDPEAAPWQRCFPGWLLSTATVRGRRWSPSGCVLHARDVHAEDGETGEDPGHHEISKSQVSEMTKHLDDQGEAFRTGPLDDGSCSFEAADALVRDNGRIVNVRALLARAD
jgi:Transposase, Mutator family